MFNSKNRRHYLGSILNVFVMHVKYTQRNRN